MKIIQAIKTLLIGFYTSIRRFPAAIGFSTATAIILIVVSQYDSGLSRETADQLYRIAMILALGIPLTICLHLLLEQLRGLALAVKALLVLSVPVILVLYYFFLLPDREMVSVTRYTAVSLAAYLSCFFIPGLPLKENYEIHVIKVFTRFLMTGIFSAVLFLGLAAILFTIDRLLGVHVESRLYYHIWLLVAGIFAPCFFLSAIPNRDWSFGEADYPRAFRVLLFYIVMPILTAYTAILYIYLIKILFTWEWPVGMVGHLVLWYSAISAGVVFLIAPLTTTYKWAKLFSFWFVKLILPTIAIMFVALWIRINAYGFTENRYFVLVLGLWVFGVMLYFNFFNKKRNAFLPVSLAAVALLSVFGPWSAYSVSAASQNNRLESILQNNGMLSEGKVAKTSRLPSELDRHEINNIIYYFDSTQRLVLVKSLPSGFNTGRMEEVFGFAYNYGSYLPTQRDFFQYTLTPSDASLDIRGYDYLLDYRNYGAVDKKMGDYTVRYSYETHKLTIFKENALVLEEELTAFAREIHKKHGTQAIVNLGLRDMTVDKENGLFSLRVVFNNIYGNEDPSTGELNVSGMDYYMLVKLK